MLQRVVGFIKVFCIGFERLGYAREIFVLKVSIRESEVFRRVSYGSKKFCGIN